MGNHSSKNRRKKLNSGTISREGNGCSSSMVESGCIVDGNEDVSFKTKSDNAPPRDLNSNLVTPVNEFLPTVKPSSTKNVALHFIKSQLSKIFNGRQSSTFNDINGNPITRKASTSSEKLRSENGFSRPIASEMAKVRFTVFPLSFGASSTNPRNADTMFRSHPKTTPKPQGPGAVAKNQDEDDDDSDPASESDESPSEESASESGSSSVGSTGSPEKVSIHSTPSDELSPTPSKELSKTLSSGSGEASSSGTTGSLSPEQGASTSHAPHNTQAPKKRSNRTISSGSGPKSQSKWSQSPSVQAKWGCCQPVAPPVYLDYSSRYSGGSRGGIGGGGASSGNAILNMLKNVDVIEELQYQVPGGDCGDNNSDSEFEYYYRCNECGEMEPCGKGGGGGCGKDGGGKSKKPVVYSRRQRFNFANGRNVEESEDGPPFPIPTSAACPCHCCRAGLRRSPNCQCRCCVMKGHYRGADEFDEIPVGKNPIYTKCCIDEGKEDKEKKKKKKDEHDPNAELLPKSSGVYFYDADKKEFVQQELRPPTPVIIEMDDYSPQSSAVSQSPPRSPYSSQGDENLDLAQVIRCVPPLGRGKAAQPEPLVLPVVYGGCCDMNEIAANLEEALAGMEQCGPRHARHKKQSTDHSGYARQKEKSTSYSGSMYKTTEESGKTATVSTGTNSKRQSTDSNGPNPYDNLNEEEGGEDDEDSPEEEIDENASSSDSAGPATDDSPE